MYYNVFLYIIMANTRFNYDYARTFKKLQEISETEKYILHTPGNGTSPMFIADRHIIPQKWGGNLSVDPIGTNSNLAGLYRPLGKGDCVGGEHAFPLPRHYPIYTTAFTQESRYIAPAWEIRNIPIDRTDYLPVNPQLHSTMKFSNNVDTRNTVKDYYLYKV